MHLPQCLVLSQNNGYDWLLEERFVLLSIVQSIKHIFIGTALRDEHLFTTRSLSKPMKSYVLTNDLGFRSDRGSFTADERREIHCP